MICYSDHLSLELSLNFHLGLDLDLSLGCEESGYFARDSQCCKNRDDFSR